MRQQTFADASFKPYRKTTRREAFLTEMDRVVPWAALCALIAPVYPKPAGAGRPPVGLERMAADLFSPALVHPLRPGRGGGALRLAGDARLCRH